MPELYTLKTITYGHYSDRGSKFTGYIHPISDLEIYRKVLNNYKLNYPKACHVCSAYRININNRIDEYASDDGEPSGSAGQPILGVLKKYKLVNVAIYVIRIYGGVNLGIPGLINAYGTASEKTLSHAQRIQWIEMVEIKIKYQYKHVKIIDSLSLKYGVDIQKKEFQNDINAVISLAKENIESFKLDVRNMSNDTIEIY